MTDDIPDLTRPTITNLGEARDFLKSLKWGVTIFDESFSYALAEAIPFLLEATEPQGKTP